VIKPTLESFGYVPRMMEQEIRNDLIPVAVLGDIAQSSLFIADITEHRPDVMIELGAAFMIKMPVILVARRDPQNELQLPFMVRNIRVLRYVSDIDLHEKLQFDVRNPGIPFP
jgi:hypothetical protein